MSIVNHPITSNGSLMEGVLAASAHFDIDVRSDRMRRHAPFPVWACRRLMLPWGHAVSNGGAQTPGLNRISGTAQIKLQFLVRELDDDVAAPSTDRRATV